MAQAQFRIVTYTYSSDNKIKWTLYGKEGTSGGQGQQKQGQGK